MHDSSELWLPVAAAFYMPENGPPSAVYRGRHLEVANAGDLVKLGYQPGTGPVVVLINSRSLSMLRGESPMDDTVTRCYLVSESHVRLRRTCDPFAFGRDEPLQWFRVRGEAGVGVVAAKSVAMAKSAYESANGVVANKVAPLPGSDLKCWYVVATYNCDLVTTLEEFVLATDEDDAEEIMQDYLRSRYTEETIRGVLAVPADNPVPALGRQTHVAG